MKYATIVPLIGGLTVANKQVVGHDPEVLFSYTPFGENEKNVKANFPNVPHYNLDDPSSGVDLSKYTDLDFISAVCPCAGLSMLSRGGDEHRAKMNEWMFQTAETVTGTLKPKVFWGENAPGLFTALGKGVRDQLREIGKKNGYSMSVYATDTTYHGIPQIRKRSFYFFWRDSTAPRLEYYRTHRKSVGDFMNEVPDGVSGQTPDDIKVATEYLQNDPYFKYLVHRGEKLDGIRAALERQELNTMTFAKYIRLSGYAEDAAAFMNASGDQASARAAKDLLRMKAKLESGGNVWDGSISVFNPNMDFLALVHRKLDSVHPTKERILTPRECMHMMGLPHDFQLVTDDLNHICQNVPVCTGADMTREVVAYLKGERAPSGASLLMQSNHTMTVTESVVAASPLLSF